MTENGPNMKMATKAPNRRLGIASTVFTVLAYVLAFYPLLSILFLPPSLLVPLASLLAIPLAIIGVIMAVINKARLSTIAAGVLAVILAFSFPILAVVGMIRAGEGLAALGEALNKSQEEASNNVHISDLILRPNEQNNRYEVGYTLTNNSNETIQVIITRVSFQNANGTVIWSELSAPVGLEGPADMSPNQVTVVEPTSANYGDVPVAPGTTAAVEIEAVSIFPLEFWKLLDDQ